MADSAEGTCELCGRHHVRLTEHHLTPKEEGGTFLPTAMLCIPCHKQIDTRALYESGACGKARGYRRAAA